MALSSEAGLSGFTLTFAVELVVFNQWEDCDTGWVEIGPCKQLLSFVYTLYHDQVFQLDASVWPHAVRLVAQTGPCDWCNRAMQNKVRQVHQLLYENLPKRMHLNIQQDKLYFPRLKSGERRYFAPLFESLPTEDEMKKNLINDLILSALDFIPASFLDATFNVPYLVDDVRHQDAAFTFIQNVTLNKEHRGSLCEYKDIANHQEKSSKQKIGHEKTIQLTLSGDAILAGAGRLISFEQKGEVSCSDIGELAVFIGSVNLPSKCDNPIFFVNVNRLCDADLEKLRSCRVTQLYTRWKFGEEVRDSRLQDIELHQSGNEQPINFDDHHSICLDLSIGTELASFFLENPFEVQLRGKLSSIIRIVKPKLFGDAYVELGVGTATSGISNNADESDILIAVTKIDARSLSKGLRGLVQGEYCLYPPTLLVEPDREGVSTNEINAIQVPIKPEIHVPASHILQWQMFLEVSMGLVGCTPNKIRPCFSRMFCLTEETSFVTTLINQIKEMNKKKAHRKDELITGFALDTGDTVLIYIEGPRRRHIFKIWGSTEADHPKVKPVFSSSARYSTRIYPDFLNNAVQPFMVLKMFVPLAILLACPGIYARPALPFPTRSVALKLGRLIAGKLRRVPNRCDMPTAKELKSFCLELCAPFSPPPYPEIVDSTNSKQTVLSDLMYKEEQTTDSITTNP